MTEQMYPFTPHFFKIELDGITIASFSEVSGIGSEIEVEDFNEGGVNEFVYKILKRIRYNNIVLKKGITDNTELYDWYVKTSEGTIEGRNMGITLFDHKENEVKRWNFKNAYPVKWSSSDLNSQATSIFIESIEIVHQGLIT